MKPVIFFLILICLAISAGAQPSGDMFYSGDFAAFKAEASRQKKPYYIVFFTDLCSSCDRMNLETFSNPGLKAYSRMHYLAYQVQDANALFGSGKQIAGEYGVKFFPTILVFTHQGTMMKRLTGFQSSDAFLAELIKYKESGATSPMGPVPVRPDTATLIPPPKPDSPASASEGLFRISVNQQSPTGFGVQVGVFAEYANVLKEVEKLEKNWPGQVLVNITSLKGRTVFKLALGAFAGKEAATANLKRYKQLYGKDGMVVNLSSYK
jgi:thioredoxin-related protein